MRHCFASTAAGIFACFVAISSSLAHVPHDIIYCLDVSPNFEDDGLIFSSSTQFGEGHLVSTNYGETFSESHGGMQRSLVTGHRFSPDFGRDGTIYMVTNQGYYRSNDRGKYWVKQASFPEVEILSRCVADDHDRTGEIYVLTSRALHRVRGSAPANETKRGQTERRSNLIKEFDKTTFAEMRIADGRLFVHRVYFAPPKKKNGMELVDYQSGVVDVLNLGSSDWSRLAGDFERSASDQNRAF